MRTKLIILIFLTAINSKGYGQIKSDSISEVSYPRVKFFSVSYDQNLETNYKIKNAGDFNNYGQVSRGRIQVMGTFPVWKKKGFTLSLNELYTREMLDISPTENNISNEFGNNRSFNTFATSINGTYITQLLKKPFVANASFIYSSANFLRPDRLGGMVTGLMIFQKSLDTRYSAGIGVFADPSSPFPVFPILSFWHRFKDACWEVDAIMPTMFKVRRSGVLGGWMSAGVDFNFYGYFLPSLSNTSTLFQNNFSELSANISYEHNIAKSFMFTIEAGYRKTFQNRISEVYKSFDNEGVRIDINDSSYFKAGFSCIMPNNLFARKLKKRTQKISLLSNWLFNFFANKMHRNT